MRLTCPNCKARYEIPDEVIPLDGRDVECSNCGTVWFQGHASHPETAPATASDGAAIATDPAPATDLAPEAGATEQITEVEAEAEAEAEAEEPRDPEPAQAHDISDPEFPETAPEDAERPNDSLRAEAADRVECADEDEADEVDDDDDDEDSDAGDDTGRVDDPDGVPDDDTAPVFAHATRELDQSVIAILRQEAERESRLRAAEAAVGLEDQPHLGLEEAGTAPRRTESATDGTEGARVAGDPAVPKGTRADRGADTDHANEDADEPVAVIAGEMPAPAAHSGFALGFGLVALLAAALILTYANARVIAETVPQLDPALSNYVGMVNQGRVWLDTQVSMLLPK